MSKVAEAVAKPFAKFFGPRAPQQKLPAGHEYKETVGDSFYERGGQEGDNPERLTPDEFKRLKDTQVSADSDPTQGFKLVTPRSFQVVPIQRAAPAPAPAAPALQPAPATPTPAPRRTTTPTTPAPAPTAPSVPPSPMGTPAPTVVPPSGGPQPSQPAQPSTPARPTVQAVAPRPVVSGATPSNTTGTQGRPRGRGRSRFVRTTPLGLSDRANTQKKTLLGG